MGAAERTVRSSVTAGESGAPSQSNLARCFARSEEHTSEFQSRLHLVCRLLLEKKKNKKMKAKTIILEKYDFTKIKIEEETISQHRVFSHLRLRSLHTRWTWDKREACSAPITE